MSRNDNSEYFDTCFLSLSALIVPAFTCLCVCYFSCLQTQKKQECQESIPTSNKQAKILLENKQIVKVLQTSALTNTHPNKHKNNQTNNQTCKQPYVKNSNKMTSITLSLIARRAVATAFVSGSELASEPLYVSW